MSNDADIIYAMITDGLELNEAGVLVFGLEHWRKSRIFWANGMWRDGQRNRFARRWKDDPDEIYPHMRNAKGKFVMEER